MGRKEERSGTTGKIALLAQNWMDFADFIKSNAVMAGCIAALLALTYGGQAFSNYYYIDKEHLINYPGGFYNWDEIGRFGLIFIKKFLNLSWYNPYLGGALLLIALWLTAMAAGYLFHMIDRRIGSIQLGIFMLLFLVYPVYAEQFLFQFQAFEVVLAIFFLMISDWYIIQAVREKNRAAFLVSIPCTVISFGVYQSMVPLQLCLYIGMFLVLAYVQEGGQEHVLASYVRNALIHFLVTFGTYEIIAKLFFSGSGYLTDQIAWKRGTIRLIGGYYLTFLRPDGMYATVAYDICSAILLIALVLLFWRLRRRSAGYVLGGIGVMISPLFLALVMGVPTAVRAQMMLPMADGLMWLFGMHVICTELKGCWRRYSCALLVFIGGIVILSNASPLMRLFYTRDVIGKADDMAAVMIVDKVGKIPSAQEGKPLIFIGHKDALVNPACFQSDQYMTYVSMSAYELNYMTEPQFFFSSCRIIGYLRTLGFDQFAEPTMEMMASAYGDCEDMPVWPLEGSVREFEEYIIVKLGER
ncbi:MAG: glucosyltransferase domain-containing protein [Lachnospiraceae bacterium]|nr:glucosyltransferase domain-containing protein [Lachnospiraceae bacterium]MDE7203144.1 glucosyltransferase domain-containing protein [Lachnospiraceae bacterium]